MRTIFCASHNKRNSGRGLALTVIMMEIPLPQAGSRWGFFLDIDGTLLAIAPTPGAVRVPPALAHLLARLQQLCDGALALVSGRAIADIDRLFDKSIAAAAGLHGMERRRADGTMEIAPISTEGLAPVQAAFYAFAATRPGLLLEDKGRTIALHYRLAPDQGPEVRRLAQALVGAVPGTLRLLEGDKVVEVQPVGFDKGRAIRSFLMEPPFGGRRPVFIGDDITDEDGFAAVAEQGGIAIRVTRDRAELPRTLAPFELGTIEAVYAWLEAAADRLEAGKRNVERPIAAAP